MGKIIDRVRTRQAAVIDRRNAEARLRARTAAHLVNLREAQRQADEWYSFSNKVTHWAEIEAPK